MNESKTFYIDLNPDNDSQRPPLQSERSPPVTRIPLRDAEIESEWTKIAEERSANMDPRLREMLEMQRLIQGLERLGLSEMHRQRSTHSKLPARQAIKRYDSLKSHSKI